MNATHAILIVDRIGNVKEWYRGYSRECERRASTLPTDHSAVGSWILFAIVQLP